MALMQVNTFMDILPSLLIFTIGTALYVGYVFIFYKFISTNKVLDLDLHQYAQGAYPKIKTMFGMLLWTVEFLIIFPIIRDRPEERDDRKDDEEFYIPEE